MSKRNRKRWTVIAGILLVLQVVASVVLLSIIVKINMLPLQYVFFITTILFLMFSSAYLLLFAKKKKGKRKTGTYVKRGFGTVLSVLTLALCIVGTSVISKLDSTIGSISGNESITETTAVYVLKEDRAQELKDISNYTLGYTKIFHWENTQEALVAINKELGKEVETAEYISVNDMVDALFAEEVGAILLNMAYEDLLMDNEEYADFSERVRVIYTNETKKEQPQAVINDKIEEESFIVYISGSDTRNKKLSTSRNDVNILAVVNPVTKQVLLLSTPRDYFISNPAGGGAKDKLTHCGIYGIDCSMEALGDLYGEEINYYAQINFSGFEKLIDELGGIEVYSEQACTTLNGGYNIKKGMNYMSGKVALAFVRERYAFSDGDHARGRHQMAVIEAIIEKAIGSTAIISNYSGIMDSIEGMFATNISSTEISELVKMQLADGGSWNIKSFSVTGTGDSRITYSDPSRELYVMHPDQASVNHASELIEKVYEGEVLTDEDLEY